jgi:hypothetical protein
MSYNILGSDDQPWYGWMFVGLAIFIVCPVWSLNEISRLTGLKFSRQHIVWLEAIFIGIMIVATILLKRIYPEMGWYEPLSGITFVALIRGIIWVMCQLFAGEFEDD